MAKHFQTKKGVIIECDVPIKEYIMFLNEKDVKDQKPSFVMEDLDSTHVVLAAEFVERIKEQVSEFVESNSRSSGGRGGKNKS